jgi:hypothetical protein
MLAESYSSLELRRAGAEFLEAVATYVIDAFDLAGNELDVSYFVGILPRDTGETIMCVGLATSHGRAYLVEDRFDSCWMVLHRSGTTGPLRAYSESIEVVTFADECCEFLGLFHPSRHGCPHN